MAGPQQKPPHKLTPRSRFVSVDGKRLETVFYPAAFCGQPTMVMLHQGLGSVAMWKDFPEQLVCATGLNVLAYSRYGYGKSARLAEKRGVDFMHHEAQVVLPDLLGQFKLDHPILYGHSDGASIALIYTGTFPSRVRALIVEAPHVMVEEFGLRSTVAIRNLYESTDLRQKLARYHDHVDEMFRGWNDIWLAPEFHSWNIEEFLPRITCPVLVIQGENDEYGTLAQIESIVRHVPKSQKLILSECGHSPHREQTSTVLSAVSQFISKL